MLPAPRVVRRIQVVIEILVKEEEEEEGCCELSRREGFKTHDGTVAQIVVKRPSR